MALPFAFYKLGVPERALGGILLGFGIIVEDNLLVQLYVCWYTNAQRKLMFCTFSGVCVGGGGWVEGWGMGEGGILPASVIINL